MGRFTNQIRLWQRSLFLQNPANGNSNLFWRNIQCLSLGFRTIDML